MKTKLMSFLAIALVVSGLAFALPTGEIHSPTEHELVFGDLHLHATYDDGDLDNDDAVSWAVRSGTCDATTSTVAGNVGGFNDDYEWDGMTFAADLETDSWDAGVYCFVFNPTDDIGEDNVRELREFYVVDSLVNGGGHLLDQEGKRKEWLDVSFGGEVGSAGDAGLVGGFDVVFHKTNALKKSSFHTTEVTALSLAEGDSDSCAMIARVDAVGTWNGNEGYSLVLRFGDADLPASASADTVRVQVFDVEDTLVYDSYWESEFGGESSCNGVARTGLDKGNIKVQSRE